jgi:putative DNA methylase
VPLASTFILSSKEGKEAYVQPVIEKDGYRFTVKVGKPPAEAKAGTKLSRGANFSCLMSKVAIEPTYIKVEAMAGRMGQKLMAIVAEGNRGRVYLNPSEINETIARSADPKDAAAMIHVPLANDPRNLWCLQYGLSHFDQLFTPRQLVALTTFSDLVCEARELIRYDVGENGQSNIDDNLEVGGTGNRAYAEAVSLFLAFALDRVIDRHSSIATWDSSSSKLQLRGTFARQALPMTWDFGDGNVFCDSSGTWSSSVDWVAKSLGFLPSAPSGFSCQDNARKSKASSLRVVSTDPPYYDNIGYADLSDYFYIWLRRSLRSVFPNLLATIAVPKNEELVATPFRHGGKENAENFFLEGMSQVFCGLATQAHIAVPLTIYYAFKQAETETKEGTSSSGWSTFLDAVLNSGLTITGTWPMRTELGHRMVGMGTNALASSIVLVARPRTKDAGIIDRRKFQRLLNEALHLLSTR